MYTCSSGKNSGSIRFGRLADKVTVYANNAASNAFRFLNENSLLLCNETIKSWGPKSVATKEDCSKPLFSSTMVIVSEIKIPTKRDSGIRKKFTSLSETNNFNPSLLPIFVEDKSGSHFGKSPQVDGTVKGSFAQIPAL